MMMEKRTFTKEEKLRIIKEASENWVNETLVDAVTRPHLCGGMVEVGKAIY